MPQESLTRHPGNWHTFCAKTVNEAVILCGDDGDAPHCLYAPNKIMQTADHHATFSRRNTLGRKCNKALVQMEGPFVRTANWEMEDCTTRQNAV